jgi:photosystem II stability/assembly factor-like uncharacterized protein
MRHFTLVKTRRRALGALAAVALAVATATVLGTAGPASASLSSGDWTAVPLPAGYSISRQTAVAPVSCVRHSQFCLTVASDSADIRNGNPNLIADAVLVTTDGGQTWTGYNTLPTPFYRALSISCWSASVCGAAGQDIFGEPQVAFTTDGGQTWTDPTPASWANVDWIATSIDCVSARTCWLTGLNGPFGAVVDPILLKTSNLGTSWRSINNLPGSRSTNPATAYALQDISCVSAASCVAVGGPDEVGGTGTVLATSNGGTTWARFPSAKLDNFQSVSCVPGVGVPACFATGTVYDAQSGADDSVIVASRTGGRSWSTDQDFGNQNAFYSITCTDASHCWAGGNGFQNEALDGTADGGRSWSLVTSSETITEPGMVSCLSVSVCVATTDDGLWVTDDDGGLAG